MSHVQALEKAELRSQNEEGPRSKRRVSNAMWQPFIQFKLLLCMLGSTVFVAIMLGTFLFITFNDLISTVGGTSSSTTHYGELLEIQLEHLFRYCGALFVVYVLLLAAVCVAYTHRLIGPLTPFKRHVDALNSGDYTSRITLRKGDIEIYADYADALNTLASSLDKNEVSQGAHRKSEQ
ncbi:MAG: hypothetical protein KTR32_11875 [Granulosicoccus sp.]|nr:hypothetical protein [Granulosicoccus sp.]